MSKRIDLTNKTFGKLTVIKYSKTENGIAFWLCQCACGNKKEINGGSLRKERSKSCGCGETENRDKFHKSHITHNKTKTRTYHIWNHMKSRCNNKNNKFYKDYGGRGITVCDRWINSFEYFLKDMGECPEKLTIDRIDNSKGYYPENCEWRNMEQQCKNRRSNFLITYKNVTKCLVDWSKELNIGFKTLHNRIYSQKWSIEKAFTEPIRPWNNKQKKYSS